MATLANVETAPCTGLAPDAIPEARKPRKAVGLQKRGVREECLAAIRRRYPEDDDKQWHVLRATYNRERQAYRYFRRHKVAAYLPMHTVWRMEGGRRMKQAEPLLPCLVFVYDEPANVRRMVSETPSLQYLRYYYNKFSRTSAGTDSPLTVPYAEMMDFIVITSVKNPYTRIVDKSRCRFKSGDMVRVARGDFEGVVGRVARIDRHSCVVVEVKGLCLVATAYIPRRDLEELPGSAADGRE